MHEKDDYAGLLIHEARWSHARAKAISGPPFKQGNDLLRQVREAQRDAQGFVIRAEAECGALPKQHQRIRKTLRIGHTRGCCKTHQTLLKFALV